MRERPHISAVFCPNFKGSLPRYFVILIFLALCLPSYSQVVWDREAGDCYWDTGLNWSGDNVPNDGDHVVFPAVIPGNDPIIHLPIGAEAKTITFENDYILREGVLTGGGTAGDLEVKSHTYTTLTGVIARIEVPIVDHRVEKEGAGTLILTGASDSDGLVAIEGTLQLGVAGVGSDTHNAKAEGSATFAGTGTIQKDLELKNTSTLSTGDNGGADIGTMTIDEQLKFRDDSVWLVDIGATGNDFVEVGEKIEISNDANFTVNGTLVWGEIYHIANYGDTVNGQFNNTNLPSGWIIDYSYQSNNQIVLRAIPEPSVGMLMLSLLVTSSSFLRRRPKR